MALSPEQDPVFPTASPSHLKARTRLILIHQRADRRSKNYNAIASRNHNHRKQTKVKRSRIMSQVKEQDKLPEKQLNEVEIGNLPEKESRIIIVKIIQDLGKRMEAKTDKMQEMFTKEELKNKQRYTIH